MKTKTRGEVQAIVRDMMGNLVNSHPGVQPDIQDVLEIAQDVLHRKYKEDIRLRLEDLYPQELCWIIEELAALRKNSRPKRSKKSRKK